MVTKKTVLCLIAPILLLVMQRIMAREEQHNVGGPDNGYYEILATVALVGCAVGVVSLWPQRHAREVQLALWINVAALASIAISIVLTWVRFKMERG